MVLRSRLLIDFPEKGIFRWPRTHFSEVGTPSPRAVRGALYWVMTTARMGHFDDHRAIERRLTAVLAAEVEGGPHGAGGGDLGCSIGRWDRRVDRGRMRPHGHNVYLMAERLVHKWVAAAVVLVVSIGGAAAQPKSGETAAQPKKILFLHSFGAKFQPWTTWSREIGRELNRQSPWPLDIQEQSLVTAQAGDDPSTKFAEYLEVLYARRPPDLVVSIGAPAARFVQRHRADLFPTTPMLLAAIEVRRVDQSMLSEQDAVVGCGPIMSLFSKIFCGCCRTRRPSRSYSETRPMSDFGLASCNGFWVRC